ncbi:HBL/NHE enterotoxin family protein [Bacillus thuringiensis]|uniref:Non-hemolytic enterotoxin lytic component L2 n=1 Tax=Bacillus thuringiensis Bt18247 TaxID=1423143 RepID=A0A9W3SZV4_BACTU|nr:HBL/NHE enterotoxin family protein [Bacillus thuringiensis]AOM14386.1 Non-hemolytic enterotoxin lytic component L2 [Bacillus thuringiensis Bt18247]AOM14493.1 Non-hemolytic enterotoxin lytic component L2 [Bacillus thuringiensis Bt18247]MBG9525821.1 hypothetical protein [Bacillus thuringiensis]
MKQKSLLTSCVITAVMAGQALPLQTFAAEKQQVNQQAVLPDRAVASSALTDLGTQTILLKTYALTLLKQPIVHIESMPEFSTQQEKAKQHALYWLDNVQPSFIDANQQLISFQQQFQNYYDKLMEISGEIDTDPQAKTDFIVGITKLQTSLANHQSEMQLMKSNLNQFEKNFGTDAQNFLDTANKIEKSLADQDGEIAQLTKQIGSINSDIKTQIGTIVGGSIGMLVGIGGIVLGTVALFTTANPVIIPIFTGIVTATGGVVGGSVTVGLAAKKLNEKQKELETITKKLTDAKANAALLTLLKGQVESFKDTIIKGKETLENFNGNWNELEKNFTDLKSNVNALNPDSSIIQNRLTEIKKSVDDIAKQAKEQEKIITNISYQ